MIDFMVNDRLITCRYFVTYRFNQLLWPMIPISYFSLEAKNMEYHS